MINGHVAQGFEPVADAFSSTLRRDGSDGAACAVYLEGRAVVDIWAGTADAEAGTAWDRQTIVPVFSSTKGMVAVAVHRLVQDGRLRLDEPVAAYWPEFAAAGKADVPVRMLLDHSAGLPYLDEPMSPERILAWDDPVAALARQRPAWEPGTIRGYHAITYGWLAGEIVRRITGRSAGQHFRDAVGDPLGLRAWIGLPDAEFEHLAPLVQPDPAAAQDDASEHPLSSCITEQMARFADPESTTSRAFTLSGSFSLTGDDDRPDERTWHRAEMPGIGGISDAAALARMYAACVGEVEGVRLLDEDVMEQARAEQAPAAIDEVTRWPVRWGLGFMLPSQATPMLTRDSFGHPGSGGSIGFADPGTKVGFGYVVNRMGPTAFLDGRKQQVIAALRKILDVDPAGH